MQTQLSAQMQRLNLLTSAIDEAYHAAARKLGLTDSAMSILYTVCSSGTACPLSRIVRLTGISRQTINSALRKLEADGLVQLAPLRGRTKQVVLTPQGSELAERTVARVFAVDNAILDAWTQPERALYLELMQRYLVAFQEKTKELSP